jgi:hypothetical protein
MGAIIGGAIGGVLAVCCCLGCCFIVIGKKPDESHAQHASG